MLILVQLVKLVLEEIWLLRQIVTVKTDTSMMDRIPTVIAPNAITPNAELVKRMTLLVLFLATTVVCPVILQESVQVVF
jgi:hypothetical protein